MAYIVYKNTDNVRFCEWVKDKFGLVAYQDFKPTIYETEISKREFKKSSFEKLIYSGKIWLR